MNQPPNPFDQQNPLENIKHILAISSGKGGVGKSTVTSNLAVALAQTGAKVGLLDADIYGPSIPRMFGCLNQKPEINSLQKLIPVERSGIKIMSLGFLVEDDKAIVWRGPMLFKAMDQLLRDVDWGELDYLLVDLPPGTGDVQLSLCQKVPVSGSLTVTTPQNVALMDVKRSVDMFKRLDVPVIGIVENMSYYLTPEGQKMEMFPKGELETYISQFNLTKAAEIPFMPETSQAGEIGIPITQQKKDSPVSITFQELADYVLRKLP